MTLINYGHVIGILGLVLSGITVWYATYPKPCVTTRHIDEHTSESVIKTLYTLE